ncbi:MAG: DegV family protein [Clostridia bacterium]|nr:DegV family protein [Clostridia bacterium]
MHTKIHVITDSTSYISKEYLKRYPFLHVVPLTVHFKDTGIEDYIENNCLFMKELAMLGKGGAFPSTSQPPPGKYVEVLSPLVDKGHEIIVITISSKLSGSYESALIAAEIVGGDRISIIDSKNTAAAQRYLLEYTVEGILAGRTRSEIVSHIESKRRHIKLLLMPSDLEHLRRGGRIGGASALLGTVLDIKPILEIDQNGLVNVFDKIRTNKRMFRRLVETVPVDVRRASVAHVADLDRAQEIHRLISQKVHCHVDFCEAGPVLAAHVGPGTSGLIFEKNTDN